MRRLRPPRAVMALPKRWTMLVEIYDIADRIAYSRARWPDAVEHVCTKCYRDDEIFWVALVVSVSRNVSQIIQDIPRP